MDFYSVLFVSAILLLAAVGLMVSHVRTWRTFRQQLDVEEEEFDYRRRQFRRRMQTSAMLGLLAIAMTVGYLLTVWIQSGWFAAVYWCAVMAVACWVALLALVDIWATKHHFGRLHHDCIVEQAKLQHEINRIQAVRGNGHGNILHGSTTGTEEQKNKGNHG